MATSRKPKTTETDTEAEVTPKHVDRVAMPSLRSDGTPDQTDNYVVLVDEPDPRPLAPAVPSDED